MIDTMFLFIDRSVQEQQHGIFSRSIKGLVRDKKKWKMMNIQVIHAHKKLLKKIETLKL